MINPQAFASTLQRDIEKSYLPWMLSFPFIISNTDEDESEDSGNKAVREKERRQANNVRERYVTVTNLFPLRLLASQILL